MTLFMLLCAFLASSTLALNLLMLKPQWTRSVASIGLALGLGLGGVDSVYALEMSSYSDARYSYKIDYPQSWTQSSATLSGERPLLAWTSPKVSSTSVSVVYTPVPADFNRLTSFGDLRGYLEPKGEGVSTQVIAEQSKGEKYTLEYVSEAPEQPKRHVITVFALRPQSAVLGVTAQALESDWAGQQDELKASIASFTY